MKSAKQKKGFTLVELMVGMVASSILALSVGLMLYYGWLSWRNNTESVAMQRDAMIAVRMMEKLVRNAPAGSNVDWDSNGISISGTTNTYLFSEICPDPKVSLQSTSIEPVILPSGTVTNRGVRVSFTLKTANDADEGTYVTTIYLRN